MSTPIVPNNRRVYKQEEVVYTPVPAQPVYEEVVQPVYQEKVYPAPVADTLRTYSQAGDAQVERVEQGYYDPQGNLVQHQEEVYDDPIARRLNILDRATNIMYFFVGALEVLLALRFVLRLLDAQVNNGFVNFIYNLSAPFVAPFSGIFNDQTLGKGSLVEFSTLIAMFVYVLLTFGLVQLLRVLFSPSRRTREVFSSTRRRRY